MGMGMGMGAWAHVHACIVRTHACVRGCAQAINVVDSHTNALVGPAVDDGAATAVLAVPFFSPTDGSLLGVLEARGKRRRAAGDQGGVPAVSATSPPPTTTLPPPRPPCFSSDDVLIATALLATAALQVEHCCLGVARASRLLARAQP